MGNAVVSREQSVSFTKAGVRKHTRILFYRSSVFFLRLLSVAVCPSIASLSALYFVTHSS